MSSNNNIQLIVRINGTLPDITTLGNEELSERAAEVKNQNIISNTSCSIFSKSDTNQIFHILVDVGQGIVQSIEKGSSNLGFETSSSFQYLPDIVLITHAHNDHIKELPILTEKAINNSKKLNIFCTAECYNQILKEFPQLSSIANESTNISFNIVQPNSTFNINQFLPISISTQTRNF
ncbi:MAG TPA: MBL fold metallo-hydrolase [Candidatus Nitrosocosmicus sp.]|nr:MBL fold metallo-hydrolase [Candidatus Nitrosocosmicus sp.]